MNGLDIRRRVLWKFRSISLTDFLFRWFEGFNWQNLKNMCMDAPIIPKIKDSTESYEEEDEFPRDDEIPPDETSGWDKDF